MVVLGAWLRRLLAQARPRDAAGPGAMSVGHGDGLADLAWEDGTLRRGRLDARARSLCARQLGAVGVSALDPPTPARFSSHWLFRRQLRAPGSRPTATLSGQLLQKRRIL